MSTLPEDVQPMDVEENVVATQPAVAAPVLAEPKEEEAAAATKPSASSAAPAKKTKKKKKASYKSMMAGMMKSSPERDADKEKEETIRKVTGGGAFAKIDKI